MRNLTRAGGVTYSAADRADSSGDAVPSDNTVGPQSPTESSTLAILQNHLVTEDHAKLFVDAFKQEVARITQKDDQRDEAASARLDVVTRELENLAANLLQGVLSPALQTFLGNPETEKIIFEARLAPQPATSGASILPHPMLPRRFEEKVAALRETLNNETVRGEAADTTIDTDRERDDPSARRARAQAAAGSGPVAGAGALTQQSPVRWGTGVL